MAALRSVMAQYRGEARHPSRVLAVWHIGAGGLAGREGRFGLGVEVGQTVEYRDRETCRSREGEARGYGCPVSDEGGRACGEDEEGPARAKGQD